MNRRGAPSLFNLIVGRLGTAIGDVVSQRTCEQITLLGNEPDRVSERRERQVAQIDTVDAHHTGRRVIQPGDQTQHRRLTRTRWADQRHQHARARVHRERLERRGGLVRRAVVSEGHLIEAHKPLDRIMSEIDRVGGLDDLGLGVQVFEDASEHRPRRLQLHDRLQ